MKKRGTSGLVFLVTAEDLFFFSTGAFGFFPFFLFSVFRFPFFLVPGLSVFFFFKQWRGGVFFWVFFPWHVASFSSTQKCMVVCVCVLLILLYFFLSVYSSKLRVLVSS